MNPDDALTAFFARHVPPARDLIFESRVAEKIARRRALATVLAVLPWTIAVAVVCWALAPLLAPVAEGLSDTFAPAAAILTFTGITLTFAVRMHRRVLVFGRGRPTPI